MQWAARRFYPGAVINRAPVRKEMQRRKSTQISWKVLPRVITRSRRRREQHLESALALWTTEPLGADKKLSVNNTKLLKMLPSKMYAIKILLMGCMSWYLYSVQHSGCRTSWNVTWRGFRICFHGGIGMGRTAYQRLWLMWCFWSVAKGEQRCCAKHRGVSLLVLMIEMWMGKSVGFFFIHICSDS